MTMDDDDEAGRELRRGNAGGDERAVTEYGSQRLVNNGAPRRRGIVGNDDENGGDEITFYETF